VRNSRRHKRKRYEISGKSFAEGRFRCKEEKVKTGTPAKRLAGKL